MTSARAMSACASFRNWRRAIAVLAMVGYASMLRADVVILKDGNRIENVRVIYQADRVNAIRSDGGIQSHVLSKVQNVIPGAVNWDPGMSEADFQNAMQKRIDELVARIRTEERRRANLKRDIYLGAVGRAITLPGWYQSEFEGSSRGFVYLAGTGLLALVYTFLHARYTAVRADYDDVTVPFASILVLSNSATPVDVFIPWNYQAFQERRAKLDRAALHVNVAGGLLALVWAINVFDALGHAAGRVGQIGRSGEDTSAANFDFDVTIGAEESTALGRTAQSRERVAAEVHATATLRLRF